MQSDCNKCHQCSKLGKNCHGPRYVAMTAHELLEWCKIEKARQGLTNAQLAERADVSKSTIDRFFSGKASDCKYESVRPVIRALVGGDWQHVQCPETEEKLGDMLQQREQEYVRLREFVYQHEGAHRQDMDDVKHEYVERIQDLRGQIRRNRVAIVTLSILIVVTVVLLILFLTVDYLNPEIGFFWLH